MVAGIIDDAAGGEDDAARATVGAAPGADVALIVGVAGRQKLLPIFKYIATDVHRCGDIVIVTVLPVALAFGNVVAGQTVVQVDIQRHIVFGGVVTVRVQIERVGRFGRCFRRGAGERQGL